MKRLFGNIGAVQPPSRGPGAGVPGALSRDEQTMAPEVAAMLMQRSAAQKVIGQEDIKKAAEILQRYKDGKANLEERIVQDELWWEMRHWEVIRNSKNGTGAASGENGASAALTPNSPEPTSAWLFNCIMNKHADAMDNFPEPVALPRERSDEESAKILSSVLPVVLESCDFEDTYSDNWWEKLKHGTAAYGVFWNGSKENGLGDIDIREIDLLKLFWEPGIKDLQKSRNLFLVDLADNDLLVQQYPQLSGHLQGNAVDIKQYIYDDTVDTSEKSVVVDWYYKVKSPNGRTLLHYVKFVGDQLLYASENDPEYRDRGFYDHGLYPVVLDVMFPEKGTPVGFGYVAICKDPQLYVDKLFGNILENAMMATKRRYFASTSTNINRDQFLNWNEPLVDVEGELDDRRLKEITSAPLSEIYVSVAQMKIEEMKDTAANRDVNSGGTGSGVTAAAAIAALQEAGNKASRDMISASYRAHIRINELCVELMRQFYDVTRSFRVLAPGNSAGYDFIDLNNAKLKDQAAGRGAGGEILYRKPVFDIKIKSQKKNPFSRMEQNERAKELYSMGFFNPERAQESLGCLDMMDFEGIDKVREYVRQGQTLMNICMQLQQENQLLKAAMMGGAAADPVGGSGPQAPASPAGVRLDRGHSGAEGQLASGILQAQQPMTGYGDRLAKRSKPDLNG